MSPRRNPGGHARRPSPASRIAREARRGTAPVPTRPAARAPDRHTAITPPGSRRPGAGARALHVCPYRPGSAAPRSSSRRASRSGSPLAPRPARAPGPPPPSSPLPPLNPLSSPPPPPHRRAPVSSRIRTSSSSTSPSVSSSRPSADLARDVRRPRKLVDVVRDRRQQPPDLEQLRDHPPPIGRRLDPPERRLDHQSRHRHPQLARPSSELLTLAVGQLHLLNHRPGDPLPGAPDRPAGRRSDSPLIAASPAPWPDPIPR